MQTYALTNGKTQITPKKEIANKLKGILAMSGMRMIDLGMTYLADRLTPNGVLIESALDHIYISEELEEEATVTKSEESSTDHVPILTVIKDKNVARRKDKTIYKRSMKDFTTNKWKECLVKKGWEKLAETEDIEKMTKNFTEMIVEAMDECAPMKRFKINTNYRHGLTKETKDLIKERDELRKKN